MPAGLYAADVDLLGGWAHPAAGITVLSGCPSAEFHRRLQEGDREGAIEVAKYYREVFDGHYYLVGGRGHTGWSENAQAIREVTLIRGMTSKRYSVTPVPDDEKPAKHGAFSSP